ncbi:MAG: Tat pathway signal protein [Hyphomonadaceae bacterium]
MHSRRALIVLAAAALAASAAPASAQHGGGSEQQDRGNERALTSAVSYVALPTFSSGVIGRLRSTGTLVVDVGLDIPDAGLRARANAMGPRLRDGLRTALSTYANTYYRDGAAPDPAQMARLMQTAVDRTLGRAGARLLIANVVYQRRV